MSADYRLSRDVWHTIELEMQLNTVGQSGGWQRLWADGTLVAEWTGMRWRTAPDVLFQAFTLENSSFAPPDTQAARAAGDAGLNLSLLPRVAVTLGVPAPAFYLRLLCL